MKLLLFVVGGRLWDSVVKDLPTNVDARDAGLISGLGRSPGEWIGYLLQYSCLENPMDTEAWQATVQESDMTERLILNDIVYIKYLADT